jgi:hypothetical protein
MTIAEPDIATPHGCALALNCEIDLAPLPGAPLEQMRSARIKSHHDHCNL